MKNLVVLFSVYFIYCNMKICLYDSGIGVLPFVKVILKKQIKNDYYLYIDDSNFPYGEKSDEELHDILYKIILDIEKSEYDYLLICCNTISRIYKKYQFKTKVIVKTILDENILDNNYKLLCTSNLSNRIDNSIDGKDLAKLITSSEIVPIIEIIRSFKDEKVILGCTHYHLLKDILPLYNVNFLSLEEKIFEKIPQGKSINIHVKNKDYKLIKKYLKRGIKIY